MSTYSPIASVTLSSAQSSVTFSGIPQTYTDLVIVFNGGISAFDYIYAQYNSDTGTNYSGTIVQGDGSTTSSSRYSNQNFNQLFGWGIGYGNDLNAVGIAHFQNYSNTTTFKTVIARNNRANTGTSADVHLWRSTSAITSITFTGVNSRTINSGSTFNLYGVANASITNTAKATGGDSVTTDGTYWYHTFRTSGTFTPTTALTADYLVVAGGGGGGGKNTGGGGGAGGYRTSIGGSPLSLTAQNYTVTVGAGGAGGTSPTQTKGSTGSNSVFSTITSSGGGGGGHGVPPNAPDAKLNGITGGSGGGGGGTDSGGGGTGAAGNSGSYSPVEGYAGGNGNNGANAGGGGGSSAAGQAASAGSGGQGGAGTSNSISGSAVTYAGGGGGGANSNAGGGGAGGGGNGAAGGSPGNPSTVQAGSGTANTGGGGGGAGGYETLLSGGAGGSGIVIVRYAV
jgi:hypothetical protein